MFQIANWFGLRIVEGHIADLQLQDDLDNPPDSTLWWRRRVPTLSPVGSGRFQLFT